jgi:hypothetical protein
MSGAHPTGQPPANTPAGAAGPAGDPSMEDILASIRRILSEDEPAADASPAAAAEAEPPPPAPPPADDVLALDSSMLVDTPPPAPVPPPLPRPSATDALIAPETEAAVASTMGGLLRTLGDHVPVYRGGPSIEDIVREEIRPLLKQWLDTHLQPLVERQVRVELERIVGRAVP